MTRSNLAVVDTNYGPNHFWDDDHIAEVCFDNCGFLIGWGLFFSLSQFLDEAHRFALEATLKTPPGTSVNELTSQDLLAFYLQLKEDILRQTVR
jgi:hypothetical protein